MGKLCRVGVLQSCRPLHAQMPRTRKGPQMISVMNEHLLMGPASSTGSPMTLMMRPRVSLPTGTCACMTVASVRYSHGKYPANTQKSCNSQIVTFNEQSLNRFEHFSNCGQWDNHCSSATQASIVGTSTKCPLVGLYHTTGGWGLSGTVLHLNWLSSVDDRLPPDQPISGVHSNRAHCVFSKMLCNLQHKPMRVILHLQCRHDSGQICVELDIDDGTNDLSNSTSLPERA